MQCNVGMHACSRLVTAINVSCACMTSICSSSVFGLCSCHEEGGDPILTFIRGSPSIIEVMICLFVCCVLKHHGHACLKR